MLLRISEAEKEGHLNLIPDRGDCSGGSGADGVDGQRKETEPSPKWFYGICEHERVCRESGKKDDAAGDRIEAGLSEIV